jgi:opacity protein-like surface antigen
MRILSATLLWLLPLLCYSSLAHAGLFEVSAGGTYRKSNIQSNAYEESQSFTGSLSYYFNDMSALELSYTDGATKWFVAGDGTAQNPNHTTWTYYTMLGLDFIFTLGERDAVLRPYVKAGVGYLLKKKIVDQIAGNQATPSEDPVGLVPSAGAGVAIKLTSNLNIKFGVETWGSQPISSGGSSQYDVAGRANIGWMF